MNFSVSYKIFIWSFIFQLLYNQLQEPQLPDC